jgi:hypothetical protein
MYRDLGARRVADMIKARTPEEIRKLFSIVNDFTPEEEVCIGITEYDCIYTNHNAYVFRNRSGEKTSKYAEVQPLRDSLLKPSGREGAKRKGRFYAL